MGIRTWLDKLRRREDTAALERAKEWSVETPEERRFASTEVEGLAADERSGRIAGETPGDVERLGE